MGFQKSAICRLETLRVDASCEPGGVDIPGVIAVLQRSRSDGCHVMEEDTALCENPDMGNGPRADAPQNVEFLPRGGE